MKTVTKWVVIASFVLLSAYDLYSYLCCDNATLSVIITDFSLYSPWMPFVLGLLMGHWFFPAKGSKSD